MMRNEHIIKKLNGNDPLFWQAMVRHYFKKLERGNPKEFKNSPKQLFTDEINARHRHECKKYNITIDQWLNICSGRLDFIEYEHSPERCHELYQFAFNLGATHVVPLLHQSYKKCCPTYQKRFVRDLFKKAASHGYADIVADLLGSPYADEFKYGTHTDAMCAAAKEGHAKVVEVLLMQPFHGILEEAGLFNSLRQAASNGHYDVVDTLLKYRHMRPNFLYEAIQSADTYGKNHKDNDKVINLLIHTFLSRFPDHKILIQHFIQKRIDAYLSNRDPIQPIINSYLSRTTFFSEKKKCESNSGVLKTEIGRGVNLSRS